MANAAIQETAPATRAELAPLDSPEFQEAALAIRNALETLREAYAPLLARAQSLPRQARAMLPIDSPEANELVQGWARDRAIATKDAVLELLTPWTRFGDVIHKSFVELRKLGTGPADEALDLINAATKQWHAEVERLRQEAEDRARREREAAELRARVLEGVERFAGIVTWLAGAIQEDAQRKAAAKEAEQRGDAEVAKALEEQVGQHAPPPEPEPARVPEVVAPATGLVPGWSSSSGATIRKNYKARVTDMMALIRHVAAHPEYVNLLELNQAAADKLAKSLEQRLSKAIPGLDAWNDPSVSRKRGR